MSEYRELRTISLDFRRISSNLLSSDDGNADVNLHRLMDYIEKTPFIHDRVHNVVDQVDYDFQNCFPIHTSGWASTSIPVDENCHIKAIYDYMRYILDAPKTNVLGQAMQYLWKKGETYTDIIQKFLDNTVKPLINFINDEISKEMILLEDEKKAAPMTQSIGSIGTVNGPVIQQGSGSITLNMKNGVSATDLNSLIEKLISSLPAITDTASEEIESVKDDLESLQEQIFSPAPKKNGMQKALGGIKKFASEVLSKASVSMATSAITGADWATLIQQAEMFIDGLIQ